MRPKKRIKIFMSILKKEINSDLYKLLKNHFNDDFDNMLNSIEKTWLENPDQRFSQLLFNMGYTWLNSNYYDEDYEYFPKYKRDLMFWGTYGKDGKQPFKYISISEMNYEHLKKCIKTQKMSNAYMIEMNNELKRKNGII